MIRLNLPAYAVLAGALLVSGCAQLGNVFNFGDQGPQETAQAENRIPLGGFDQEVLPEEGLKGAGFYLPDPTPIDQWALPGANPEQAPPHADAGKTLSVAWKRGFGAAAGRNAHVLAPPVAVNGNIYVMDGHASVSALDARTGEVLASRNVGSDGVAETADDCVVAGDCTRLKNALQADPVATGPADSRFITKAYAGDLDGRIWRFDIGLNAGAMTMSAPTKLYDSGGKPLASSMATVNVGGANQYLFQGTGSDLLPTAGASVTHQLAVVLDNGATGATTATVSLEKVDGAGVDEKVSGFPAVAGDIVFFTTTSFSPATPCTVPSANLYAFTFIGGPAYDTNGDGRLTTRGAGADTPKVKTVSGGRASAPFVADQRLVFAAGGKVELFGDPQDFNNGVGQAGVRILSWRDVR